MAKIKTLLYCCMSVAVMTTPARAQEASARSTPAGGDKTIPEIIVTAQKRSEKINDVPLSISALGNDELQTLGVARTEDLGRVIPGFNVQETVYGTPVFYIRGVGFSDPTPSISPAVSVYSDEVLLPYSIMARGAALDVERVEILKGPQGTLFGQNSTGGAVNYIAAKPTRDLAMGGTAGYSRFNTAELSGYISGPLSETLAARLSVQGLFGDDWQNSTSRDDTRGGKQFMNGRILLDWTPSDRVRWELAAQGWQDKSDTQAPQFIEFTPTNPNGNPATIAFFTAQQPAPDDSRAADWDPGSPKQMDNRFYRVSLRGDIDFSKKATLTSITAYANLKYFQPMDGDGTSYTDTFLNVEGSIETFSQELRLAGDIDRLHWLIGGNYEDDTAKDSTHVSLNTTNNTIAGVLVNHSIQIVNQWVKTWAIFGDLDYKLTDTLTLRGSGRYTEEERRGEGCLADAGDGALASAFTNLSFVLSGSLPTIAPGDCVTLDATTLQPASPIASLTVKPDNFAWRGTIDWKAMPDALLYATVAKGFKSGSFASAPALTTSQLRPAEQESVLAYEAGLKTGLFDDSVQLNLAGFYYDYKNKQVTGYAFLAPFGPLSTLINIPDARVIGAEFNVNARPMKGLKLQLSGTYLDTKVQSDPDIPRDPLGESTTFVGESFPNTPEWQFNGDVEQSFRLRERSTGYVGATVAYRSWASAQFGRDTSERTRALYTLPSYTLLDLRAGVRFNDGKSAIELWGRNVTDKFYLTSIVFGADAQVRFTGMPATYGIRFTANM